MFTVVFTVVFTVCSLRVHCVFTVRSLRLSRGPAKGPSSALVEAQLGPFLTHFELNAVESSSDQLGLGRRAGPAGKCRLVRCRNRLWSLDLRLLVRPLSRM